MILVNGLSPSAVLLAFGLFYVGTGLFYRLPVPVQPLKAVGAIAIANPEIVTMPTIAAAGILFGAVMLALWALGSSTSPHASSPRRSSAASSSPSG